MKSKPRKRAVDNKDHPAPFDLLKVKSALKEYNANKYGKVVAARLLPAELEKLHRLRDALPPDVAPRGSRLKDGGVLKACFLFAAGLLLGNKAPKKKPAARPGGGYGRMPAEWHRKRIQAGHIDDESLQHAENDGVRLETIRLWMGGKP